MGLADEWNPAPKKTSYKRRVPKRGNSGKFSDKTRERIGERDEWLCVRCKSPYVESVPHHIIYKSQLGKGTVDNGVTICRPCHDEAHSKEDVRRWFESYREQHLLRDGAG